MGYLKLAIILGVLIGTIKAIQWFNHRCRRRFGHRLFTMRSFWLNALGVNGIWWGLYGYATASRDHTTTSGALVLMAMGLIPLVWLVYENVRDTDLIHGVGGSALQLLLFFPLALYSIPLLVIAMLFMLFAAYKGGPAWLIDE